MRPLPSAGFSITVRVSVRADPTAVGCLTTTVGEAGGVVTALDVVDSDPVAVVVDLACDTADAAHAAQITSALGELEGVQVRKVSDRTFLLHLGGKIEVTPKISLRNRDELSRAYTPGVARVCLAIAENPDDARRLTMKRNTVAVVTDGSAVLGLGNLGPEAALPVMEGKAALFKRFGGVDAWPVVLDNPDPEVDPRVAREHAAVVATGRSDQPNQINNVLAFPGVFRGMLDAGAHAFTGEMALAATVRTAARS